MSATAGKVALVSRPRRWAATAARALPADRAGQIVDLVGYGNATFFEGSAAAPALTNTTAALRGGSGCLDTDQNGADFTAGAPSPRNSAAPTSACTDVDADRDPDHDPNR